MPPVGPAYLIPRGIFDFSPGYLGAFQESSSKSGADFRTEQPFEIETPYYG